VPTVAVTGKVVAASESTGEARVVEMAGRGGGIAGK
jgi:hypothetical protein